MGELMREGLTAWRLNGERQTAILCSPGEDEVMLTGLLLTSGRVRCPADVTAIVPTADGWDVSARLSGQPSGLEERLARIAPGPSDKHMSLAEVKALSDRLMTADRGPGLHSVTLTTGRGHYVACDIGRHNALDKAVGMLVRAGDDPTDAVLCTSGRISIEVLAKAAAVGVPILCTCKQVGDMAAAYAAQWRMAVVQLGRHPGVFGAEDRVTQA